MNLNQYDRRAFVDAVMADVPKIDYEEQARTKATAAIFELMPAEVKRAYETCPEWLNQASIHTPGRFNNLYLPRPDTSEGYNILKVKRPKLWDELEELSRLAENQCQAREVLKGKLTATIAVCRTLKQARERLPEFEKYLPSERDNTGTANLPAVANLVADLTKAGWPKDKTSSKGKK